MPQTRGRVYFILVKEHLASKDKMNYVFRNVLERLVHPAFNTMGSCDVHNVRVYTRGVLKAMGWEPTLPKPSQD